MKPLSDDQIAQVLADGVPPLAPHVVKDLDTAPWTPSTKELPYSDEDLLGYTTPAAGNPGAGGTRTPVAPERTRALFRRELGVEEDLMPSADVLGRGLISQHVGGGALLLKAALVSLHQSSAEADGASGWASPASISPQPNTTAAGPQ